MKASAIPPLDDYDMLWVMGGPMDVWDVEEHPWLIAEKRAIRRWVRELEAAVPRRLPRPSAPRRCARRHLRPAAPAEVGILDIELTEAGRRDPIFAGMAPTQKALQWHSVSRRAAAGGRGRCWRRPTSAPCQAMRIGDHAYSMQYHVELEADTIPNWGKVPAYEEALAKVRGPGCARRLQTRSRAADAAVRRQDARRLYRNFMALRRRPRHRRMRPGCAPSS